MQVVLQWILAILVDIFVIESKFGQKAYILLLTESNVFQIGLILVKLFKSLRMNFFSIRIFSDVTADCSDTCKVQLRFTLFFKQLLSLICISFLQIDTSDIHIYHHHKNISICLDLRI